MAIPAGFEPATHGIEIRYSAESGVWVKLSVACPATSHVRARHVRPAARIYLAVRSRQASRPAGAKFDAPLTLNLNPILGPGAYGWVGGNMKSLSVATATRRFRAHLVPDLAGYAPLRWLVLAGIVLMAAIAIGTTLPTEKLGKSGREPAKRGFGSSVLLLARHFDQQFDDF